MKHGEHIRNTARTQRENIENTTSTGENQTRARREEITQWEHAFLHSVPTIKSSRNVSMCPNIVLIGVLICAPTSLPMPESTTTTRGEHSKKPATTLRHHSENTAITRGECGQTNTAASYNHRAPKSCKRATFHSSPQLTSVRVTCQIQLSSTYSLT